MNTNPLVLQQEQVDGEEFAQAAWDVVYAHAAVGETDEEIWERVRQLPQPWRAVYTLLWMESELLNGGLSQFFLNSEGTINRETFEDLQLISAEPFVELFDKALRAYAVFRSGEDSAENWDALWESLPGWDDAFYDSPKTVSEFLNDYIRANLSKYTVAFEAPV